MFSPQRTFDVVAYFGSIFCPSCNGEEFLNKFLNPDPDHVREGPSHGHSRPTYCVKKRVFWHNSFLSYASGQTVNGFSEYLSVGFWHAPLQFHSSA